MKKVLFTAWIFVLLIGCNASSNDFLSVSKDGETTIRIQTEKPAIPLAPCNVTIKVKNKTMSEQVLAFEIQAAEISNENTRFEWKDNQHCLLFFEASNDGKRIFEVTSETNHISIVPLGN